MVSIQWCRHVPFHICGQGTSQADGAGIVDKNVNATKLLHCLLDSLGYLILISCVHNTGQAFTPSLFNCQTDLYIPQHTHSNLYNLVQLRKHFILGNICKRKYSRLSNKFLIAATEFEFYLWM